MNNHLVNSLCILEAINYVLEVLFYRFMIMKNGAEMKAYVKHQDEFN